MSRPLAHLSDEALVLLAGRSEQPALAELYDRYGRTAYGLALRVLRDEALAEDAVQEGFLALWRTAAQFVPERGKASTWILTLVHRRAVDTVRREQRRRADSLEHAPEPSTGSAAEDALPAPRGKTYEAWIIPPGKAARPAGLFAGGGRSVVHLRGPVPAGAVVAVTVERAGGASAPTQQPIFTPTA